MTDPNGRTALYRLFDAGDELLYVGISRHPDVRWRQHQKDKTWWPQVVRKELLWHDSRLAAGAAEQRAIDAENPRFNGQRGERRIALISPRGGGERMGRLDTPAHPLRLAVEDSRTEYEAARAALFVAIKSALGVDVSPAQVARDSGFSRTYIGKIRDGRGPGSV